MTRYLLLASLLVLLAAGCAGNQRYSIAVIGDMPYMRTEQDRQIKLPRYHRLLAELDVADVTAVVHVGDYTTGPFCGDSVVNERFAEFSRSAHPFVFVFGDNDWTDCARGNFDPLERLTKLRTVFTQGNTSLGRTTLLLVRQSDHAQYAKFRENVRWTLGNEQYVALNLPGSWNNWGESDTPSAEYVERNAANLAWLREAFDIATRERRSAIAIFIQANPGLVGCPRDRQPAAQKGFTDFNAELQRLAVAFGKPVLLVHGDTHYFRTDMPFIDPATNRVIANITRVEGFGDPNHYWVRLLVEPGSARVFTILPEIVPEPGR